MRETLSKIKNNINKVIVGKENVIDLLLTALLAEGHILIDDVPGLAKTKMAHCLALSVGTNFKRIQFTPDLQPSDITGIYYYNQKKGDFEFRSGPILSNIVLADEINRAVPRTQSSLLEAMQEQQVSVEGTEFKISDPFMVVATQNPVELEGTFPLPEAQLDRFLMKIDVGYPEKDEEVEILHRFKQKDPIKSLKPVVSEDDIIEMREEVKQIKITEDLINYIIRLAIATRNHDQIELGISPRGSLSLMKASMAYAYINDRDYVLPDDIKYLFSYVSSHRIILDYDSEIKDVGKADIIDEILSEVEVPVEGGINE
ncbi:MAG: AAA family ATPase [Bacillota bacterium]